MFIVHVYVYVYVYVYNHAIHSPTALENAAASARAPLSQASSMHNSTHVDNADKTHIHSRATPGMATNHVPATLTMDGYGDSSTAITSSAASRE